MIETTSEKVGDVVLGTRFTHCHHDTYEDRRGKLRLRSSPLHLGRGGLEEAADTSTYEVVDLDFRFMEVMGKQVLVGCTILTRRSPEESLFEMGVGPWVPLLRVEPS